MFSVQNILYLLLMSLCHPNCKKIKGWKILIIYLDTVQKKKSKIKLKN